MISPIHEFCNRKMLPKNIADAFNAYARAVYSERFLLRGDTDTIRLLINQLTEEQMEQIWQQFVLDLKNILPSD